MAAQEAQVFNGSWQQDDLLVALSSISLDAHGKLNVACFRDFLASLGFGELQSRGMQELEAAGIIQDGVVDYNRFVSWLYDSPCEATEHGNHDHSLKKVRTLSDPCVEEILGTRMSSSILATQNGVEEDRSDHTRSPSSLQVRTETVADSTCRWMEPSQTLIFCDWDDTLFPTTHLFDNWKFPSRPDAWDSFSFTMEQQRSLDQWQEALFEYMRVLCALTDRLCIVTNAKKGWVEECITRFAPRLQAYFNRTGGPRVVYAREYSAATRILPGSPRGNPTREADECMVNEERSQYWTNVKLLAMRKQAKEFYSQYPDQTWKNILSFGDARYEHDAARDLGFQRKSPSRERLRVKTIITPAEPSVKDLTCRLKFSALMTPVTVKVDGDLDVDMNSPDRLQVISDALNMPQLKNVIRPTPLSEEDEAALEAAFDELTIMVQDRLSE